AHEPFADVEPAHELHHTLREIDHLDTLVGLDDERFAVNGQTAGCRRRHVLDGRLANRDGRTLAHVILSVGSESSNVTRKTTDEATLLYSRLRASRFGAASARQQTFSPAATRSWVRSPHGPATVSGFSCARRHYLAVAPRAKGGREDAQASPRVRKPGHRGRFFFGAKDAGRNPMRTSRLAWTAVSAVLLCRSVSAATISGRVVDQLG